MTLMLKYNKRRLIQDIENTISQCLNECAVSLKRSSDGFGAGPDSVEKLRRDIHDALRILAISMPHDVAMSIDRNLYTQEEIEADLGLNK